MLIFLCTVIRNNYGFRFTGRVHEQIRASIEAKNFAINESNFIINHYGYNKISKAKLERNLKLLQIDYSEDPGDNYILYHLAHTYHAMLDYEKSQALFAKVLISSQLNDEQRDFARLRVAQAKLMKDEYDEIINLLLNPCMNFELEGLRKFILGAVYFAKQDYSTSYENYNSSEVFDSGMTDKALLQKVLPVLQKIIA